MLVGLTACEGTAPLPAASAGASSVPPASATASPVAASASAAPAEAVVLASGQIGPAELAVDDSHVYWVASGGETQRKGCAIMSVAKGGGEARRLADGPCGGLHPVVVDATRAYWTTTDGKVTSVPKTGGAPTVLASGETAPYGIAVDASGLFWVNLGNPTGETGAVRSIAAGGGPPSTLATGQRSPSPIALDANGVYWLNADGTLMTVARSGGAAVALGTGYATPVTVAVDDSGVYVASAAGGMASGSISRVDKKPGGTAVTIAAKENWPSSIALDGTSVYWTTLTQHTLVRSIGKKGGVARTLYAGAPPGRGVQVGLAVDAGHVYFTSADKVLKLRK